MVTTNLSAASSLGSWPRLPDGWRKCVGREGGTVLRTLADVAHPVWGAAADLGVQAIQPASSAGGSAVARGKACSRGAAPFWFR